MKFPLKIDIDFKPEYHLYPINTHYYEYDPNLQWD
jgi:hypothetical protein